MMPPRLRGSAVRFLPRNAEPSPYRRFLPLLPALVCFSVVEMLLYLLRISLMALQGGIAISFFAKEPSA
jgi:hypothetical protein